MPAPDHRFHYLSERSTSKPLIEADDKQALITWAGFESDRMGKLDIEVKQSIQLVGNSVHFRYEIRNGSQATIESYTYPRLKGLRPPSGEKEMRQVAWNYRGMSSTDLWPTSEIKSATTGMTPPAQLRPLGTDKQFCLILSDSRGLYMATTIHIRNKRFKSAFSCLPRGWIRSTAAICDPSGKVGDSAIGIDPNYLCFVQPGASQQAETLVLQPSRAIGMLEPTSTKNGATPGTRLRFLQSGCEMCIPGSRFRSTRPKIGCHFPTRI